MRAIATKRKYGMGLFYLMPSYLNEPPPNPVLIPGFTNPYMKGIAVRETWERLCQDGYGTINFDWLDDCFDAAETNDKFVYLQIEPGRNTPPEFYDLPNAKHIVAGVHETWSTVPGDPVFLSEFTTLHVALSNRYKNHPKLKFLKIQGPGISSESFFAKTPTEWDQADVLASELGYVDKYDMWLTGVKGLIDMHATLWYPVPVQLVTGSPFGTLDGSIELLQTAYDYGDSHYLTQFAAVAHDLNSVSPHEGTIGQTIIVSISPHSTGTGYQFGNEQNDATNLELALNRGIGNGAHEIEVFAGDADEPSFASILATANAQMLSV